jgi:hypothetical protein
MSSDDIYSASRRGDIIQIILAGLPDDCAGPALQQLAPVIRKIIGLTAAPQQASTADTSTVLGESNYSYASVLMTMLQLEPHAIG